jgi:hypothetical protein
MPYPERVVTHIVVLAGLVRAALLVLALQLGGVIHTAADVLVAIGFIDGEHETCPADGACDDCLAGCPNCHCGGALRTVAPEGGVAFEALGAPTDAARHAIDGSRVPRGPTLPSLYRPPRAFVPALAVS